MLKFVLSIFSKNPILSSITKNKIKEGISFFVLSSSLFFVGCENDKKNVYLVENVLVCSRISDQGKQITSGVAEVKLNLIIDKQIWTTGELIKLQTDRSCFSIDLTNSITTKINDKSVRSLSAQLADNETIMQGKVVRFATVTNDVISGNDGKDYVKQGLIVDVDFFLDNPNIDTTASIFKSKVRYFLKNQNNGRASAINDSHLNRSKFFESNDVSGSKKSGDFKDRAI